MALVAGEQHDLVDGDGLLPRRPGHRDRPAPADVAGAVARERWVTTRSPSATCAEVLADVGGVDDLEQRGAGGVDRRDSGGVGLGRAAAVAVVVTPQV